MSIKGKKYGDIHYPEFPREYMYKEQDVKNEFQNFMQNNILKKMIYTRMMVLQMK